MLFFLFQHKHRLYQDANDPVIEGLINDMKTMQIVKVEETSLGSQLKFFVTFENGARAMMKPQRFDHEHSLRDPNQFPLAEFERANAEIASFHLDKVLGFNWVPPAVGRFINITSELLPLASNQFNRTVFISPAKNICFFGSCKVYCDLRHPFCGKPDVIEVALKALIPLPSEAPRQIHGSPWERKVSLDIKYQPFPNERSSYCRGVKSKLQGNRLLLDMIDIYIFDFIGDNKDRQEFETFKAFVDESFPFNFDNGRA